MPLETAVPRHSTGPAVGQELMRFDDVGLEYRTRNAAVRALDGVDLSIREGEFAVLVGPSGCGKSSLLYLAAGLSNPTEGEIRLDGRAIDGPGPDRGMVFQSYTLFPWLSVRDNIAFGLKQRGMRAAEREPIVDRYLAQIGLGRFEHRYPSQLSGGMKQRVAIARAMANEPEILLMDEPFGALDSQTRTTMQGLLIDIWEKNRTTVLFVTHDIDEAILLADRIFVMSAHPGRIREVIEVGLPRPRSLRMTVEPGFIALKQRLFELLYDGDPMAHVDD